MITNVLQRFYESQCIALYHEKLISKALTKDHAVLPATHAFIHKWNEPYLPLLHSRTASSHFGWYSFSVQLRVEGWVGLSGWLQTEVVYPPADGHSSQY